MDLNIIGAVRQRIDSIVSISDAEFKQSIIFFKPKRLKKGEYFVNNGEVCNQIGFIGEGILRTFMLKDNDREVTTCFCSENHFTTSLRSLISQTASNIAIQAIEESELLTLDYKHLQFLYANTKVWQTIGRVLAETEYLNMESYALGLNKETAKEKYTRLLHEQPSVVNRAPVQHIASYLGVTRETLSRIRRQVTNDSVTFVK